MDESEENMSSEDIKPDISVLAKVKPKKRSLVERELETSLTARVTSPVTSAESSNTSRYGRARRLKTDHEVIDVEKVVPKVEKSPVVEKTPVKIQSPVYRMHASNSLMRSDSPKGTPNKVISLETNLENQIENIYQENISLSRFGSEEKKVTPKVYVRKDLIQTKEEEESITLIKNLFSPVKSANKSNSHINNILERSSDKYELTSQKSQNGYASVVKTLDFDSKRKKENKDGKTLSKNELFELEAKCEYQVGDLAWSRMGTYPFWPCIVTRDPTSGMFVKKKLFGRIERDVLHVTYFGDNGRRSWIVDTMLRKFHGQLEFEATREQFTRADKKKDPRLYAAFFISEKKIPQWNVSVEEAELLLREPKRLRIDLLNDMLLKTRPVKTTPKQGKSGKITRTASDVSLSESLYDTLFSEDDGKEDSDRSKNKSRNMSLDVSEVVTACLDNMAAKTGNIKIQKQSHMDIWLQKAKSKTPEKSLGRAQVLLNTEKKETKAGSSKKKKSPKTNKLLAIQKPYSFRRSAHESQNVMPYVKNCNANIEFSPSLNSTLNDNDSCDGIVNIEQLQSGIGAVTKVESLSDSANESVNDDVDVKPTVNDIVTDDSNKLVDESKNVDDVTSEALDNTETSNEKVLSEPIEAMSSIDSESNAVLSFPESDSNSSIKTTDLESHESKASIEESKEVNQKGTKNNTPITQQKSATKDESKLLNNLVNGDFSNYNTDVSSKDSDLGNFESSENISNDSTNINENLKPSCTEVPKKSYTNPEFIKYLEMRQDNLMDQYPDLSQDEIVEYLHNTWLYGDNANCDTGNSDSKQSRLNESKSKSKKKPTRRSRQSKKNNEYIPTNVQCEENDPYIIEENISETIINSINGISNDDIQELNASATNDKMEIDVQNKNNEIVTNINEISSSISEQSSENTLNELKMKEYISDDKIPECEKEYLYDNMDVSFTDTQLNKNEQDKETFETLSITNNQITSSKPINIGVGEQTEVEMITNTEQNINGTDSQTVTESNMISIGQDIYDDETSNESIDISYAISPLSEKADDEPIIEDDIVPEQNNEYDKDLKINGAIDTHNVFTNGDSNKNIINTDIFDNGVINKAGPKEIVSNKSDINLENLPKSDISVPNDEVSSNEPLEVVKMNGTHVSKFIEDLEGDNSSINSEDSEPLSVTKTKLKLKKNDRVNKYAEPEFVTYLELRQDDLADEHPELNQNEIVEYLYKTWLYEENSKSDIRKTDDVEQSGLIKGLGEPHPSKKRKPRETKEKKKVEDVKENSDIENASVKSEESVSLKRWLRPKRYTSKLYADFDSSRDTSPAVTDETVDTFSLNSLDSEEYRTNNSTPNDEVFKVAKANKVKDLVVKPIKEKPSDTVQNNDLLNVNRNIDLSKTSDSPIPEKVNAAKDTNVIDNIKEEFDPETVSIKSEGSDVSLARRKQKSKGEKKLDDSEFAKYLELRQDALIDENPQLTQEEIVNYLYKTWLYEESVKSDIKKSDEIEQSNLIKGINQDVVVPKKARKKIKEEKDSEDETTRVKPKRKTIQHYYNEDYPDIEDELAIFEIMKNGSPTVDLTKMDLTQTKTNENEHNEKTEQTVIEIDDEIDEVELYFEKLTMPKPNVFRGLIREKVCEICEKVGNLVKCKGCNGMFHMDCVKNEIDVVDTKVSVPNRGRKKKKKKPGRKPKNLEDSGSMSDEKSQDVSAENMSIDDLIEPELTVDADNFEAQLSAKMKELLESTEKEIHYDSYSSDDGIDWENSIAGKCEIVDVVLKPKSQSASDFKCNNCQKYELPVCFVCKLSVSKTGVEYRQRCQVAHCHKYYHLECLDHWPQTQFSSGEKNKKSKEAFESHMCPRHVCHTCVSDDPRGCKTRFSGDKLARCVRCPATYHSFTKCLPAGTRILTGSHIICPRHYQHRPGKVPCHVNTGWCFICALGGTLICCEYCPTSFHAECLNISPPEGNYMCEDCETGRLPLYGEMVWVKLGHYRWWPGIVLHPSEIPDNIMAVKHSPGEFVVRFFGQYDHYWVNRGRVFPFQEGDSGKVSSQKSKIDAAFTTAMEHAQRACQILKNAQENEEESIDIASSLLPPHYVKLKVNKPCGSLVSRRVDLEESSLTQCECGPADVDPCGPYSQCLNRMLLTECGPICRAGDRCNNRAFEQRRYPKLVPYRTPHRGWGLKTLEDIKAGQFVIEYVGELIDEEEFRRRMARKHEIRDENFYFLTLDKERMIDAGPKGNLARFMNHCCEPNCETQKWTVLGDVRVGLFAINDIPANSEVTFNYLLECASIDKKKCMCGAPRCAGYIGAKPKQDESQSKKGKIAAKRTYKKRKNTEESPSTKTKPKRPVGRPAKPKELTEIEKDLLIIKNATNGISSDSECSRLSSLDADTKALKRKRVSFSTEEVVNGSSSVKKVRLDDEKSEAD